MSSLVVMLTSGGMISTLLFLLSYAIGDYWENYGSVTSIEGGFLAADHQWQEGMSLNFGWILVLFVLFDVELVAFVTLLFVSQMINLILLIFVLFGSVLVEWGLHSLNW